MFGRGSAGGSSMPTYEGTAEQNKQLSDSFNYDSAKSLVDQMNAQGKDSSFDARAQAFSQLGGQQGPGLLGRMKQGFQNFGESYKSFEDDWRKNAIAAGYMQDPNANNPFAVSPENQALSNETNRRIDKGVDVGIDEIGANATTKKDYQDMVKSKIEYQNSPEGQAYKETMNNAMMAPYKDRMGSPSGFVNYFMNKWFKPKFDYNVDSSMIYDTPPNLRD